MNDRDWNHHPKYTHSIVVGVRPLGMKTLEILAALKQRIRTLRKTYALGTKTVSRSRVAHDEAERMM